MLDSDRLPSGSREGSNGTGLLVKGLWISEAKSDSPSVVIWCAVVFSKRCTVSPSEAGAELPVACWAESGLDEGDDEVD